MTSISDPGGRHGEAGVVAQADAAVLGTIVAQLNESVCITDADLDDGPHILFVNEGFTRLTGYAPEEVIGKTPRVLQGARTDRAVLDRVRRDLRAGREFRGEAINYKKDGTEFVMSWYVRPLRIDGRITRYFAVQRDATDDRGHQIAAQLFHAAVEHAMDAIMILDGRGTVLHANPACEALAAGGYASIAGRPVRESGLTPRKLRTYRDIISALEIGGAWQGEYDTSARRGELRRLSVTITRAATLDEWRFVVTARDVTHQRRLEYIADAANLVENVGYVFAGLRHELGNPINSIKTALTVVRQNLWTLPPERVEGYLDRVLQEVARVEYLLRSMASFNATQKPVIESVPVAPFLTRFASMIRTDVERRGVELALQFDESAQTMSADPRALHQVLLNLLTNALDAVTGRPKPRIRVMTRRRGGQIEIFVIDNGPGIPVSQRQQLFKPFQTTKPKGTGLGLVITRKLVTLMHGTVEAESTSGGETAFVVSLDADMVDSARNSTTRPPPPSWRST